MSQTLYLGNSGTGSPLAGSHACTYNANDLRLPGDHLVDQSCCHASSRHGNSNNPNGTCITSSGCTHYHNHYEGQGPADKELIRQCFDQMAQSLAQLHEKDQLIQKLVNTQQNSSSKNVELRRKLKRLKAATARSL